MNKHPTRRDMMLGVAALATATAFVTASSQLLNAATNTPIAQLWAKAESLRGDLGAFSSQIAAAETSRIGGVSGWMYLDGAAYRIGNARYDALVALLKTKPQNANDLALMAKAARDADMLTGPRGWATARVAEGHALLAA